jgi:hypothetical protein
MYWPGATKRPYAVPFWVSSSRARPHLPIARQAHEIDDLQDRLSRAYALFAVSLPQR